MSLQDMRAQMECPHGIRQAPCMSRLSFQPVGSERTPYGAVLSLRPRMEDLSPASSPLSLLYLGQVGFQDRGREVQEVFLGMVRSAVRR